MKCIKVAPKLRRQEKTLLVPFLRSPSVFPSDCLPVFHQRLLAIAAELFRSRLKPSKRGQIKSRYLFRRKVVQNVYLRCKGMYYGINRLCRNHIIGFSLQSKLRRSRKYEKIASQKKYILISRGVRKLRELYAMENVKKSYHTCLT